VITTAALKCSGTVCCYHKHLLLFVLGGDWQLVLNALWGVLCMESGGSCSCYDRLSYCGGRERGVEVLC
jgi:hypothetical protein